jgi:hypothetical protein
MQPMGQIASVDEMFDWVEQYRYDVGNPLERYLINRHRRKEGRPLLRPSP